MSQQENDMAGEQEAPSGQSTLGKALQQLFQQEELLKRLETQESRSSLLMNDARREIFFRILREPCLHMRGLAGATGLDISSARWHISKLTGSDYILFSEFRNKNIYWVNSFIDPEDKNLLSLLRDPYNFRLVRYLAKLPEMEGMRENRIARFLKIKQQMAYRRLRDLENMRILESEGIGYGRRYGISPHMYKLHASYKEDAITYHAVIARILIEDGLKPVPRRRVGSKLYLELNLPGRKEKRTVECNPLASVLGATIK